MGPHLGCGDALCASGCSFSYRCRARVSLVMTHGYQPVTRPAFEQQTPTEMSNRILKRQCAARPPSRRRVAILKMS